MIPGFVIAFWEVIPPLCCSYIRSSSRSALARVPKTKWELRAIYVPLMDCS